ncbi:Na(+)/H(+) antiporter subunit D [Litorimonas sp. WD9-15]|uniref:Na(+)/H(+) antiporter subunit D n=1 Tax=Litorimonas sp. WD9-15 TaxID=3418716 RepID=UPI003D04F136
MIDAIPLLAEINPGFWVILAGLICALLPIGSLRKAFVIAVPLIAGVLIFQLHDPTQAARLGGVLQFGPVELTTFRLDSLSLIWAYLFCLAGIINGIYGLHEKCRITDSSALIYTGAAISGVLAGDMITLFIMWELTAISSVFLIWKGGEQAYAAGIRYLAIQVLSGVMLLTGAILHAQANGGDFTFGAIGLDSPGGWLMLLAMGIKCGFPMLHMWMQDAYPKASITGTVILASFTTKFAIYALARGFAGEGILIWVGAIMAIFPIAFAIVENDLRRILSYSINSQLGFMVAGIGVGSAMALNGVAGHVFVNVLAKGLLFMSVGAVMHRVGTAKASELGGLFRSMPFSTGFALVGAMTLAATPLFAGFITKAFILTAVIEEHHYVPFVLLLLGAAGMVGFAEIKVPYSAFFGRDSGRRVKEAPWNMHLAMGIAAFICVYLAWPFGGYAQLYALMPFEMKYAYKPYTVDHVAFQLQLLFGVLFAFNLFLRWKRYRAPQRAEVLDVDWLYRRMGLNVSLWASAMWTRLSAVTRQQRNRFLGTAGRKFYQTFSPAGAASEATPSGLAAVLTAGLLFIVLMVAYIAR